MTPQSVDDPMPRSEKVAPHAQLVAQQACESSEGPKGKTTWLAAAIVRGLVAGVTAGAVHAALEPFFDRWFS